MANPALAAVLAAAAQKVAGDVSPPDQLRNAGATSSGAAIELDLTAEGSREILAGYLKLGHIREAGFGRYWLDEAALARDHGKGVRGLKILLVSLLIGGLGAWLLLG